MSLEAIIGIAGAIVTALALAWSIYTYWQRHRKRVAVELRAAFLTPGFQDTVVLKVINRSTHPIRVASVGLNVQDDSGRTIQPIGRPPGATIPGDIRPQDSGETFIVVEEVSKDAALTLTEPLTGWVTLSTGERIESKPTRCLSPE